MSLPLEQVSKIVQSLQASPVPNFIAQAKAKQILQEVREVPENFPDFTPGLDERATFIAYRMLAAGCSYIEHGEKSEGHIQLHAAADLLESVHQADTSVDKASAFHCLIGGMAFYACGHFSRAFVQIKRVEAVTPVAGVIASLLRKDFPDLISRINTILLVQSSHDENLMSFDNGILDVIITRAVASLFEHNISGSQELLEAARSSLYNAMTISEGENSPTFWWISRLLGLMVDEYQRGSLWTVLPPRFEDEDKECLSEYIRLLALSKPPVVELWQSQLACVDLALDEGNIGGVINLRTSSGKTRVAELAILKTLTADPVAKVLYLAPFRSLAFELERTFGKFLGALGYSISHLYGGSRFSGVDREIVAESRMLIATPEKAKAMLRAAPELFDNIKLVVVDEGHLLGENERNVRNELFLEGLRILSRRYGARILLLSAVLPNAEELASWVGGNESALIKSFWKPSGERFGMLRWSKQGVQIEWKGSQRCFNPHFIEFRQVVEPGKKRGRRFPKTKTEAVAATAVRLVEMGPVLIFAAQARWVDSMARAVLLAFGNSIDNHDWPDDEWNIFEAVCHEELGSEALVLNAARLGVVCHSNKLPPQVRIALERLMAIKSPRVIVATTTLGQGVNLGISSVIVAQTMIGHNKHISKRDFWNICGRAGRAYIDSEGKILFAIDATKDARTVRNTERRAEQYFDVERLDKVESGLLSIVRYIKEAGRSAGVSFDVLLELIANRELENIGDYQENIEWCFDLIDDQLLALHLAHKGNDDESDITDWVEDAFRESFAAIQVQNEPEKIELLQVLEARTTGILRNAPSSTERKALVSSGLPLSVGAAAFCDLDRFREMIDAYLELGSSTEALDTLIKNIELWARENATQICKDIPDDSVLDVIRPLWIGGTPLQGVKELCGDESSKICSNFYGYELSWLCHSVAQNLGKESEAIRVEALSLVGLLLEIGVSSEGAAKVFLAGVRSREVATELSIFVTNPSVSVHRLRGSLLNPQTVSSLSGVISPSALKWLHMLSSEQLTRVDDITVVPRFRLNVPDEIQEIHARKFDDKDTVIMCSTDGRFKVHINSTEMLPFNSMANNPRFVFVRDGDAWIQYSRDPRIRLSDYA